MMTRSGKKSLSFKEKCRMVRNNKDIVDDINEYLRANEKLINSEYRKIVNKSLDKKLAIMNSLLPVFIKNT